MNCGDYTLRRSIPSDAPAIWALISKVLLSYGFVTDPHTTDRDLVEIDRIYAEPHGAFFVLLDGGRLIGTVAFRFSSPGNAELCRMYLDGEYRGKGLGRRLLEHVAYAAEVSGAKHLHLKTASVLHEAISLYRKAGFTLVTNGGCEGNCDVKMEKLLRGTPDGQRA